MSSISNSQDNNQLEKPSKKVKIGKEIYIYRILYLITKEDIFRDKSKKNINFYLKNQSKEKSLFFLPKPQESDIIIEDIKELIELTLSLCILSSTSNYKISIFTSNYNNIENNVQLLNYQGTILYAKLNEIKTEENEEKKILKIGEFKENLKKNKIKKIEIKNRTYNVKEFPSFMLKQIFPYKKFGITSLNNKKDKEKESNEFYYENPINKEKNNKEINRINNYSRSNSNTNMTSKLPHLMNINSNNLNNFIYSNDDTSNIEKNINSHSFHSRDPINGKRKLNFFHNSELENNKLNYYSKSKLYNKINKNISNQKYFFINKRKCMSNIDFSLNSTNCQIFPIPMNNNNNNKTKNILSKTLYRKQSLQNKKINILNCINNKNGSEESEVNILITPKYFKKNIVDSKNDYKTRNRFKCKKKNSTDLRCRYFSKSNSLYSKNSSVSNFYNKKIKTLFTRKTDDDSFLKDVEKQHKEILLQQQNVKMIKNFLFKPSIISTTKNNFYNMNENRFNSVTNIYIDFKNELKTISYKLNDYIGDKEMEIFVNDVDKNFTLMGINLKYCFKEFILYSYFDKYIKETFPSIADNLLYDPNITSTEMLEVLNSLLIKIYKLKNEEKFNLADFARSLKKIKSCKLSSDFFEIFVICPNYFEFTKREVTKKIMLVLEIDSVTNNVTIENFINYFYIFKYGHLVKLDKKLLFINKLLHMIDEKGGALQEKIYSDVQYLFKIDNRTKQILLGRPYEIKMNFHMTLKINQIFNSIVNYFEDINNIKDNSNVSLNTSYVSSFTQIAKL